MNPPPSAQVAAHVVGFYVTDEYLIDQISAFVEEGLVRGQHVLALATNPHWTLVAARLDERGVPHGRAAQQGRLIVADAQAVLDEITVDGVVDVGRFREMLAPLIKGTQPTRIYGEVVALLAARGDVEAAAAIEELGGEISRARGIRILCTYHAGAASSLTAADVARLGTLHDRSVSEPGLDRGKGSGTFHAVRFYKDSVELSRIVADFLAEGLAVTEPGLIIGTPTHRLQIVEQLHARGFDVQRLQDENRLFLLDADALLEQFMLNGMPDPGRFRGTIVPTIRTACGNRKDCTVRAYGEMVDVLWRKGQTVAATRLEMLWNDLAGTHDFSLLCGYAMGNFYKDADVQDICGHHSHLVRESGEVARVN